MTGRPAVSLCVIPRDEARNIVACLESADFCDEAVVLDSGSTDATRELDAAQGARVTLRDWPGHIAQKNRALDAATHDWVLCVDADERVTPELRASILAALARPDLPDGFTVNRRTFYLGKWIRHGGWYPDRKLRLFRRSKGRWGGMDPHDHVYVEGRVEHLAGDLLHFSYDSLSDHLRTIHAFTTTMARERHERGRSASVFDVTVRPAWKFVRMYVFRAGFLDGVQGLLVALLGSYYVLLKYVKLMERARGWDDPSLRDAAEREALGPGTSDAR